jgi:hypothetical protein
MNPSPSLKPCGCEPGRTCRLCINLPEPRKMTDAQRLAIEEGRLPGPPISPDAQFIASKIVTHMWIIFVLLPVVGVLLLAAMRGCQ